MYPLRGAVQNYAWGKKGLSSLVAQYHSAVEPTAKIDDNLPYAELWFGSHPSAPSLIIDGENNCKLSEWLSVNPLQRAGNPEGTLPFLLKILSIAQPLSIQAHPDKKLAQLLHSSHPDIYRDPNHKPEIAIALSPFESLCSFQRLENIAFFLNNVPEFKAIVGDEISTSLFSVAASPTSGSGESSKQVLKTLLTAILTHDKGFISSQLSSLLSRLTKEEDSSLDPRLQDAFSLLQKTSQLYPGDVGNWCVFLLNHLRFDSWSATPTIPGSLTSPPPSPSTPFSGVITRGGLFMGPNEPHAYVEGDIIECMACSDNVVRAGLTPKLLDVPTLCSMLTYSTGLPTIVEGIIAEGDDSGCSIHFSPPTDEFRLERIQLDKAAGRVIQPINGPSIFLCVSGQGKIGVNEDSLFDLIPGSAFYVTPNQSACLLGRATNKNIIGELVVFRVTPNPEAKASL